MHYTRLQIKLKAKLLIIPYGFLAHRLVNMIARDSKIRLGWSESSCDWRGRYWRKIIAVRMAKKAFERLRIIG